MLKNGDEVKVDNPTELPEEGVRDHILEPYVKCEACLADTVMTAVPGVAFGGPRVLPIAPPDSNRLGTLLLPAHRMEIITPKEYVGSLIELSQERRGDFVDMKYMTEARTTLVYEMPLAEVRT
jgi:translation elongation factor EF-4